MPFLTEPPLSAPPITLSSLQFSTSLLHLKCPFASLLLAWARTETGHPRGKHRSTRTLFGTWQSRNEGERGGKYLVWIWRIGEDSVLRGNGQGRGERDGRSG